MNKIKKHLDIIHNEYAKKDITILHLSDIHFSISTNIKKLNKIKEYIYLSNPDYVMITGDTIDSPEITKNKYKIKELVAFLSSVGEFTKVIISLGNHDIAKEDDYKFFRKLDDLKNIYILNNTTYKDEYIFVSGFTLPINYYYNIDHRESPEAFLSYLNENHKLIQRLPMYLPKIALIHSPIKILKPEIIKKLKEYDLILSGHTHGGLVPDFLDKIIPKNIGFVSPGKKLFPEIARGKIEKYINNKKITIIINSGVTKLSLKSGKSLSKFNFLYNISINKIIITKKRGKYNE